MAETKRKKLGIIGGLGPAASVYFYNRITQHTKASCDQEHIDIVLLSHATTPDRTRCIISGEDEKIIRSLRADVETLVGLGVDNIAIPCNTTHYYLEQVQEGFRVPIIHMVRESVDFAVRHRDNVKKIGIMATDGTIRTGIYDAECRARGVSAVHPSDTMQKLVMSLIYDDIKAGRAPDRNKFDRVVKELCMEGCDVVILACTELSVYKEYHEVPDYCLDAMDVLVRESILRSGAEYI